MGRLSLDLQDINKTMRKHFIKNFISLNFIQKYNIQLFYVALQGHRKQQK